MATRTREQRARERVRLAYHDLSFVQSEANWTNGYRAGKGEPAESELFPKEMALWKRVDAAAVKTDRALAAYRRAVLAEAKGKS